MGRSPGMPHIRTFCCGTFVHGQSRLVEGTMVSIGTIFHAKFVTV